MCGGGTALGCDPVILLRDKREKGQDFKLLRAGSMMSPWVFILLKQRSSGGGEGGDCELVIEQMAALREQILHLIPPLHPHLSCLGKVCEQSLTLDEDLCKEKYRLYFCLLLVWPLKEDSFLTNYKYRFFFAFNYQSDTKGLMLFLIPVITSKLLE